MINERSIGRIGKLCANQRLWGAWALKTWKNLMRLCLLSKCGDYLWTVLLSYRVFSAKYFPRGSIFVAKATLGSYAWQSIAKARKLVQTDLL